jgi:hypothetical protein
MTRERRWAWVLVLACALAVLAALADRPAWAQVRPEGGAAGSRRPEQAAASAPMVHGLAPLPGGAQVPLAYRPPGAFANDGGPNPLLLLPQKITIRYSHKLHVRRRGLSCLECHPRAATSRQSSDSVLPSPTACDRCHGSDHRDLNGVSTDPSKPSGQCSYCHLGYVTGDGNRVARQVFPRPRLRFGHAAHHRRNIGCRQCHGLVDELELATIDPLPLRRGCTRCHQMPKPARGEARAECSVCHLTEPDGRLATQLGKGYLRPPRWLHSAGHDADWSERHKTVGGTDSRLCANCHTETSCTDCHDGRVRPRRTHSNDWLSLHAIAARQDNPRCTSCHRYQSFCLSCHQRAGVAQTGPYANFASRGRFHPPKAVWSDAPRSARHHGWEAQRNLSACVGCHVERDCAVCHSSAARGGPGAGPGGQFGQRTKPHPPDFRRRCSGALARNARPCLLCHAPSDPNLRDCR